MGGLCASSFCMLLPDSMAAIWMGSVACLGLIAPFVYYVAASHGQDAPARLEALSRLEQVLDSRSTPHGPEAA